MFQIVVSKLDGDKNVQLLALLRDEFSLDEFLRALTAKKRGRKPGKPNVKTPNLPLEQ